MNDQFIEYFFLFLQRYGSALMRGTIILGSMYALLWLFKFNWVKKFRIKEVEGYKANPLGEIKEVLITYIIYSLLGVLILFLKNEYDISSMYLSISEYGIAYTVLSFFLILFLDDAGFYWSHLAMHKSKLLLKSHMVHHKFVNTTPFAAYAFHIGEAIINASRFFIIILFIPLHPIVLLAYIIIGYIYNGMIHSGYDFFPVSWRTNPVMKWLYTPTHHALHHKRHNCNYAFMFTFWDKWMKTEYLPSE